MSNARASNEKKIGRSNPNKVRSKKANPRKGGDKETREGNERKEKKESKGRKEGNEGGREGSEGRSKGRK